MVDFMISQSLNSVILLCTFVRDVCLLTTQMDRLAERWSLAQLRSHSILEAIRVWMQQF